MNWRNEHQVSVTPRSGLKWRPCPSLVRSRRGVVVGGSGEVSRGTKVGGQSNKNGGRISVRSSNR